MSFWTQLKRRKIVQVAATYAVTAWLLVQVVTTIEEPMALPGWVDSWAIRALIIGFPVVIIIAWVFDLTAAGLVRDTGDSGRSRGRRIEYALLGLVTIAAGWLIYGAVSNNFFSLPGARLSNSVAILAFDNLSPDPGNDYIADGFHEEVLNAMAKLQNVSVSARTSVLRYRDGQTAIPQIAEELNVETVMEGSLRYADGRVRITAQLIDGFTGSHLWSEIYERPFDDAWEIQSDIARNIVDQLRAELTEEDEQRLDRPPTDSPEAHALFLQARAAWGTDRLAVDRYLERAIALDPSFAQAYAMRASNYAQNMINTFGASANELDPSEIYERIQALVDRALEIDPTLGQAYGALATAHRNYWRWTDAKEAFERGRRVDPSEDGDAWFYSFIGEHSQAVDIARRWVAVDPRNAASHYYLGAVLLWDRRTDEAIASFGEAIALDPASPRYHLMLARAYVQDGDQDRAFGELRIARELWGDNLIPLIMADLAYVYSRLGFQREAADLVAQFETIATASDGAGTWTQAALAKGDQAEALRWLEIAVDKIENHQPDAGFYTLMVIKFNESIDPVLEQPEFVALRRRIEGS